MVSRTRAFQRKIQHRPWRYFDGGFTQLFLHLGFMLAAVLSSEQGISFEL